MKTIYEYRVNFAMGETILVRSEYAPREVAEQLNGDFEFFAKNGVIYPKSQITSIELFDEIEIAEGGDEDDFAVDRGAF